MNLSGGVSEKHPFGVITTSTVATSLPDVAARDKCIAGVWTVVAVVWSPISAGCHFGAFPEGLRDTTTPGFLLRAATPIRHISAINRTRAIYSCLGPWLLEFRHVDKTYDEGLQLRADVSTRTWPVSRRGREARSTARIHLRAVP
jgi:hypothetical protein